MSDTLASYLRFFVAGLTNRTQTGAVVPSQRFLIGAMLAPIPTDYTGCLLELGAGTGALTFGLAAHCPQAHILACEINPTLSHDLKSRIGAAGLADRVEVVSDSAQHQMERLRKPGLSRPGFVLSGIPLGNLDKAQVLELIRGIRDTLAPGGLYIQFQHSLVDRKKIRETFSRLRTAPVLLNFPPAFVYYAQK